MQAAYLWSHTIRWQEWINREHLPKLRAQVEQASRYTYEEAVRFIYTHRPRGEALSREASAFWANHRGLAIYALLARPVGVGELERSMGLSQSVLYHLLTDWHVRFLSFSSPPRITAAGVYREYEGYLFWRGGGYVLESSDGAARAVKYAHWDGWLVLQDVGPVLTGAHAVRASRFVGSPRNRNDLIPLLCALARRRNLRILDHPHLPGEVLIPQVVLEEVLGRAAVAAAMHELNHCGCAFWSDAGRRCELGWKDLKGPACADYVELE